MVVRGHGGLVSLRGKFLLASVDCFGEFKGVFYLAADRGRWNRTGDGKTVRARVAQFPVFHV